MQARLAPRPGRHLQSPLSALRGPSSKARHRQGQLSKLEGLLPGGLSHLQQRHRRALHECRVWAACGQRVRSRKRPASRQMHLLQLITNREIVTTDQQMSDQKTGLGSQ